MFERYSLAASSPEVSERFSVEVPKHYKQAYNAGPSQLLPVITHQTPEGLSFFYWGLAPNWAKNKTISEKLINTKGESIAEKTALKKKLSQFRCLIPADGFYAWKKVGKKTSIPYRFFLKSKSIFSLGGLWEEYEDENEETHHTFSIITVKSNSLVTPVSERMPLMLDKATEGIWLNKNSVDTDLLPLLKSSDESKMDCYTVSPRISSLSNNSATLLLPTAPADQFGNLTLFD